MSSPNLLFPSPNTSVNLKLKAFLFDANSIKLDSPSDFSPFTPQNFIPKQFFPISGSEEMECDDQSQGVSGNVKGSAQEEITSESLEDSSGIFSGSLLSTNPTDESKVLKRKGKWTEEDDANILALVAKHGKKWNQIARLFSKDRNAKQIRERFINHLDSSVLKTPFSASEEEFIIRTYSQIGPKWTKIASMMPGRTENMIKNKFHLKLKNNLSFASSNTNVSQESLMEEGKSTTANSDSSLKRSLPFEYSVSDENTGKRVKISLDHKFIHPMLQSEFDQKSHFRLNGMENLEKEELVFIKESLNNCCSLIDSQISLL